MKFMYANVAYSSVYYAATTITLHPIIMQLSFALAYCVLSVVDKSFEFNSGCDFEGKFIETDM